MPLRNLIVIVVAIVLSMACYSVATKNRYANLFAEAMTIVDEKALQDVPREKLFIGAMNGMMDLLDKHSIYMAGDDFRSINEDITQKFGGVGMYVDKEPETGRLIVLTPIPNTPAFRAGVRVGDEVYEIAGVKARPIERIAAIKLMRGIEGTEVDITLKRGEELIPVSLMREDIPVPSVHGDWRNPDGSWQFVMKDNPRVGYIRLLQFGRNSSDEIQAAVDELDGKVDGLILDLRNNAGGLLNAAVEICDIFLEKSATVVLTKGRKGVLLDEHYCANAPSFPMDLPLVVLVNRHSASASEIVAGCLQDHARAVIVGEQSWGKGTVQDLIPIEKNRSALKLTVASFWRPSEKNIDRYHESVGDSGVWGIQPNDGLDIEMDENEVFNNIRRRNQRDLQGLGGKTLNTQTTKPPSEDRSDETSVEPDRNAVEKTTDATDDVSKDHGDGTNADGSGDLPELDFDRPLKKAIDYIQRKKTKKIAA